MNLSCQFLVLLFELINELEDLKSITIIEKREWVGFESLVCMRFADLFLKETVDIFHRIELNSKLIIQSNYKRTIFK